MKISLSNAERLQEIAEEMVELLNEYKEIAKRAMTPPEWERFRYNTLAHLEPGLQQDNNWVTNSSVKGLDTVAETAIEESDEEEDPEAEDFEREEKSS